MKEKIKKIIKLINQKGVRYEWRFLKGMMRRNLPYRQEGAYELEDTALVAKREQELPLEVISSIGA